jgi:hypothetical protein
MMNKEELLGQTEFVIQLLRDFRLRAAAEVDINEKWQLTAQLANEIEKEHIRCLYQEKIAMNSCWIESWEVQGSGTKFYKVSKDVNGCFGCSCPAWINEKGQKTDCKHILRIKLALATGQPTTPLEEKKPFVYQPRRDLGVERKVGFKRIPAEEIHEKPKTRVIRFED